MQQKEYLKGIYDMSCPDLREVRFANVSVSLGHPWLRGSHWFPAMCNGVYLQLSIAAWPFVLDKNERGSIYFLTIDIVLHVREYRAHRAM